jgi:hypothetical protein
MQHVVSPFAPVVGCSLDVIEEAIADSIRDSLSPDGDETAQSEPFNWHVRIQRAQSR